MASVLGLHLALQICRQGRSLCVTCVLQESLSQARFLLGRPLVSGVRAPIAFSPDGGDGAMSPQVSLKFADGYEVA